MKARLSDCSLHGTGEEVRMGRCIYGVVHKYICKQFGFLPAYQHIHGSHKNVPLCFRH